MTDDMNKGTSKLQDETQDFVVRLDKLYYEKPAGYLAYIATCISSMRTSSFSEILDPTKPTTQR